MARVKSEPKSRKNCSAPRRYKMVTFIRCPDCGDEICSLWQHDFQPCRCGNTFIDGGFSYCRIGGKDLDNVNPFRRRISLEKIQEMVDHKNKRWREKHGG